MQHPYSSICSGHSSEGVVKKTCKVYSTRQSNSVAEIQIIDRVKELLGNFDTEYKNVGKVPNQFYEIFNKVDTE